MFFYRTFLTTLAAIALTTPVFADENHLTASQDSNGTVQLAQASEQSMPVTLADNTATDQQAIAPVEQSKVNLNKADAKELSKVKGLNVAKARAMIAYRKKHGDFKTLDELTQVKGFKKMRPEKLKEIQDQLTIEG